MWRLFVPLTVVVPSAGCLLDDDRVCTLVGWDEGLNIDLQLTPAAVAGDAFELVARADGVELTIRLEQSYAATDCTAIPQASLTDECMAADPRVPTLSLRAFLYGETGWLQLVGGPNPGGPAVADISAKRNGVVVTQRTYTPVYQTAEPNGPGCGTFVHAHGSLVIPP